LAGSFKASARIDWAWVMAIGNLPFPADRRQLPAVRRDSRAIRRDFPDRRKISTGCPERSPDVPGCSAIVRRALREIRREFRTDRRDLPVFRRGSRDHRRQLRTAGRALPFARDPSGRSGALFGRPGVAFAPSGTLFGESGDFFGSSVDRPVLRVEAFVRYGARPGGKRSSAAQSRRDGGGPRTSTPEEATLPGRWRFTSCRDVDT
jgi:hypothetical protein